MTNYNKDWYFSLSDRDENKNVQFDHSSWERIQIPHDWSRDFPYDKNETSGKRGGFVRTGIGWYRKELYITKEKLNKRFNIHFDGVYMNSDVYINGHHLGHRPYGYISFCYDLEEYLVEGLNIISVRVDNSKQESSRWYNGCGIYRNVWLKESHKISFNTWGRNITTKVLDNNRAEISISSEITNRYKNDCSMDIIYNIYDQEANSIYNKTISENITDKLTSSITFTLDGCKLWSTDSPYLYSCEIKVVKDGVVQDREKSKFGIRKIEFKPNQGFYLNNINMKLKGVCLHHDSGVVGAAVTKKILKKRVLLLKDMGCNAIRTAHNPFSSDFYDVCDELGIMVMDEIFDGWETKKASYDYGLYFEEWHKRDLTDFIRRDRNHPSIIMWSIGNEVLGMRVETSRKLQAIIKNLDTTRPITCGVQGVDDHADVNRAEFEIAGYNDGGGACFAYDRDHERRPNQLMVATEAPHTSQTRGFYRTQTWWRDKNQPRIEIENLCEEELFFDGHITYSSSYDNAGVRACIRDSWTLSEDRPYLMGEFRWSGFDYYGESFNWPARYSDSGVIGMDNIPKDSYYLYQSMWSKEPMVHLLPHWTHPNIEKGTKIPVWVYSNCEEVELFLNNQSLGKRLVGSNKYLQWDVPYIEGSIKAISYNSGVTVSEKGYSTSGTSRKIQVISDDINLTNDGNDVIQIDVNIFDEKNIRVPYADNIVSFKAVGDITILGTENGDHIDTTPLISTRRNAFYGSCMAVVQSELNEINSAGIYVSSILGDKVFKDSTLVSVDAKYLSLDNSEILVNLKSVMQINSGEWFEYKEPIKLSDSSKVVIKVYNNKKLIDKIQSSFIKGERDKVIDLAHGNKVLNLKQTVGPFSEKLFGYWTDGQFTFNFKEDGLIERVIDKNNTQKLGSWWYDFPLDFLEVPNYAGQGEIWFDSGEKNSISMLDQRCIELELDNTNGSISTAYGFNKKLILRRTGDNL
ncbi:MAG: DUF4982 domain-containing protein [Spirochaetaceae bacterium]